MNSYIIYQKNSRECMIETIRVLKTAIPILEKSKKILCDTDRDMDDIEWTENYFSLVLEGYGLQSYNWINNIGLNAEKIQECLRDSKMGRNDWQDYLVGYRSLLVRALELLGRGSEVPDTIEITEEIMNHMKPEQIWEDIKKLQEDFYRRYGFSFPQDAKGQTVLFTKMLSREWTNSKSRSLRKFESIDNDQSFFMLYGYNQLLNSKPVHLLSTALSSNIEMNGSADLWKAVEQIEEIKKGNVSIKAFLMDGQEIIFDVKELHGEDVSYVEGLLQLYKRNILSKEEFLKKIPYSVLSKLQTENFDSEEIEKAKKKGRFIGRGIGASPFVAVGRIFSSWEAVKGENDCIVVKEQILPDDVEWVWNVSGVITRMGSITSHPSVIMRQLGKAFVCGCENLKCDKEKIYINGREYQEGDTISIDGKTGEIYEGVIGLADRMEAEKLIREIMDICYDRCGMTIYVNSEKPEQVKYSLLMGCSGIGLYRTEYMKSQRSLKRYILQYLTEDNYDQRRKMLEMIQECMRTEFVQMFRTVGNCVTTVRTFDFPMHELLDHENDNQEWSSLREYNPMLGNRGCRLSILYPELFEVQIDAVCKAYLESGRRAKVKILLPMIADVGEIIILKEYIIKVIDANAIRRQEIQIGSMVETPRALVCIDEIAEKVDFLSYGTNDLTQMMWGISRDDSFRYLPEYVRRKIINGNPFVDFDVKGILEPIQKSIKKARRANPKIKIGICGEQVSERESLIKALKLDIDYISINPTKVMEAMLLSCQYR